MIGGARDQGIFAHGCNRTVFALCFAVTLSALVLGTPRLALTQEPGETPPKDIIFARKIMMGSIDMNMDEIETMTTAGGTLNLTEGREHADIISIMLMSFPHLFPARTNQWTPNADRDPATDTYAAPELWSNFPDFYERAASASKIAFDASNAKAAGEFRNLITQLRTACNSCHAIYQKTD
jgi:cytochrome c556